MTVTPFYEDRSSTFALRRWATTILALVLRDLSIRAKTKLSAVLIVFEPISYIVVISALFYAFNRKPSFGHSMVLFHSTGIFPFFLFIKIIIRSGVASVRRLRVGHLKTPDLIASVAIVEFFVFLIPCLLVCAFLLTIGVNEAIPVDPNFCALAILSILMFSSGIGLILASLPELMHKIITAIARGMLLVSAVFYVVDSLPFSLRRYIIWNPVAQAITLFRMGVYENYPCYSFNGTFLTQFSVLALLVGLCFERCTRARSWRWEA